MLAYLSPEQTGRMNRRVAHHATELLLVSGYSGVGKSARGLTHFANLLASTTEFCTSSRGGRRVEIRFLPLFEAETA